jgi:hypothetical protein
MRFATTLVAAILIFISACQDQKIAALEKQNQELRSASGKRSTAEDYDFQAKCSKDARTWFNDNWSRDKDTVLLNFTNHYNKAMNKCMILVEYHYSNGYGDGSWTNHISLTDVYENVRYGDFAENHMIHFKPTYTEGDTVITCEMGRDKCKTIDEFNGFVNPYMNS